MSNIVAIIVTYNVSSSFSKNVDALLDKVAEIIVVDNGSKQETINMLDSLNGKISLIKLNENKGIAYALNRGIEYALNKSYEWILTLDHDSIVDTNMLTNMLKTYDKMTEVEKEKVVMITPTHVEEKEMSNKIVINSGYEYVLTEITSGALTKAWYYSKNKYDEKLFIDMDMSTLYKAFITCLKNRNFHKYDDSQMKLLPNSLRSLVYFSKFSKSEYIQLAHFFK